MFWLLLPLISAWPGIAVMWLAETPHPLAGLPLLPVVAAALTEMAFGACAGRRWLRQHGRGPVLVQGGTGHDN